MKIFFTVAFVAACSLSVVACGAGDSCTSTSKCKNDPKPTDAEIKSCQDAVKTSKETYSKCMSEIDASSNCMVANQQCTSEGTSDVTATLAKCSKETTDLTNCFTAK